MADQEHVQLLKQGVADWNAWREKNRDVIPDLTHAELEQADLRGADLSRTLLEFANLEQAKLVGANLRAAQLLKAKVAAAELSDADLSNAGLAFSDLTEADLTRATLISARLTKANLTGAKLMCVNLSEADLQGANLTSADLNSANLNNCDLSEANLNKARLMYANLQDANLSNATLEDTVLSEAVLYGVQLSNAKFQWVDLSWASLTGVDFSKLSKDQSYGRLDFTGAKLISAKLWGLDLRSCRFERADLTNAFMGGTYLLAANFDGAILRGTYLDKANLEGVNLRGRDLTGANLSGAYLRGTDLRESLLTGANLEDAQFVQTMLEGADISGCRVYGVSAWDIEGAPRDQSGLIVTPSTQANITVDDLEVAQFIYLLLRREKLRNVIDTITSKAVLILGRFTPERKEVLVAIADELRKYDLLPIIFDFERSTTRDFTETIKTLAGLSLFVIADITNPKSAPLELQATVPDYQIPFIPIQQEGEKPFSMFADLTRRDWVLEPVVTYRTADELLRGFKQIFVDRAWKKHQELLKLKAKDTEVLSVEQFLKNNEST